MPEVISVHEYVLKPETDPAAFEAAIQAARERGILRLPGLVDYHFLRGIRGTRRDQYTAIWIYRSREAWEALWGPVDAPHGKEAYPAR